MNKAAKGEELAKLIHDRKKLTEKKKVKMDEFRTKESDLNKEIGRIAMEIETGQETLFDADDEKVEKGTKK